MISCLATDAGVVFQHYRCLVIHVNVNRSHVLTLSWCCLADLGVSSAAGLQSLGTEVISEAWVLWAFLGVLC